MKIIETEEVPKFKPVTVVFEGQAEIDYITYLVAASRQEVADCFGLPLDTYELYQQLKQICTVHRLRASDVLDISINN